MAFVVGSPCVGCKDTACVTVCPVDCFYEGPDMLYLILMSVLIVPYANQNVL